MNRQMNRMAQGIIGAILLSSAVTSSPAAIAADWGTSLSPEAVDSYLPGAGLSVIVVAAGGDTECEQAVEALFSALSAGTRADVVIPDDSLGDISTLGDADIVTKAAKLPVDLIAVARVFPSAGHGHSLVLTLYDKAGELTTAFTVGSGEVLTAQPSITGQGVTTATATATTAVTQSVGKNMVEAKRQYEDRFVWFGDMASVASGTGEVLGTWSVPYKGKYREPLDGREFYDYVGRTDLGDKYESRMGTRRRLLFGGLFGMIGGGALAGWGMYDSIENDGSMQFGVAGLVLVGLGGVGMTVGATVNPNPVDNPTCRRLAEDFNRQLAAELGLEPLSQQHEPTGDGLATSLTIVPWLGPETGGIAMRATF